MFTTVPRRSASPRSGRPSTSSTIVCERSPFATEPITRATSVHRVHHVGDQRVDRLDHLRPGAGRAGHAHALAELAFLADLVGDARDLGGLRFLELDHVVERVCAISPSMPVRLSGMRTEKSPRLNARSAFSSSRGRASSAGLAAMDSMEFPDG